MKEELIKFLKYINDNHTNSYGPLEVCESGDKFDPTYENIVKEYLDSKITTTIKLDQIKESDGWHELAHELKFNKIKEQNKDIDEEELLDKFYTDVVNKYFKYGEFADISITVDDNFNIVGGKIHEIKLNK